MSPDPYDVHHTVPVVWRNPGPLKPKTPPPPLQLDMEDNDVVDAMVEQIGGRVCGCARVRTCTCGRGGSKQTVA